MMKRIRQAIAVLLAAGMLTAFAGCEKEVTAENLMEGITPQNASAYELDENFCKKYSAFSVNMLRQAYAQSDGQNVLVSPLSTAYNLALLYNGSSIKDDDEIKSLFGHTVNREQLNIFMHSYVDQFEDTDLSKLYFENAAWFNADKNATVKDDFLQTNATYFGSAMYKESFGTDAVTNISNWISNQSEQQIEYIVDELPQDVPLYLMSTVMLDASWSRQYSYTNIQDGIFTNEAGEEQKAQMMSAFEYKYISDEVGKGFIKDYAGGNYSFVALLPNDYSNVKDCIDYLASGDKYLPLFKESSNAVVDATMPKFSCEYKGGMSDVMKDMGLSRFFNASEAKLENLGQADGGMYAGDLFARNIFSVTEKGTSKGTAATVADDNSTATGTFVITLDRPFIFMVVDTQYHLPIMMGVVSTL